MKPFSPGSHFHQWTIQEVLSWGHRGGLYRIQTGGHFKILKQILFPVLASPEDVQRREETERAINGWSQLGLAQAISVEDTLWHEESLCLILPELQGQPLAVEPVLVPPASAQLVYWCEQILSLVLVLQRQENPMRYSLLDPDHVILDSQRNHPVCFNPGWAALAWSGAGLAQQPGLQKALRNFGTLVQLLSGSQVNLSPALLWLVGRCMSENPAQNYASFEEVRLSLQRLPIRQEQRSYASRQSLDEFPEPESLSLALEPPAKFDLRLTWLVVGLAVFSLLFLMAAWLQPPPQPLPELAIAAEGRVLFLTEQGKDLGAVDLKAPIRDMIASPSGDVLYLALEESPQIAVLGVSSRRLRYLGLSDEAISLDFALGALFCLQRNGQLAVFEKVDSGAKSLPGQSLEALSSPLKILVRADSKEFLVLESNRLLLMGAGQSQAWESWTHPQLVSALGVDTLVLASLREGFLQLLSPTLAPLARQSLPGGAGRTQLYPNDYRRQFWSLHNEGILGLWNYPEVNLAARLDLGVRPAAVADDPQGRLWVVGDQGELVRVDSQDTLRFEMVARLESMRFAKMAYLHHPQGSATSR